MKYALKALMVVLALGAALILGTASAMAQELPDVAAAPGSDPEANLPYLYAVYTVTWVAFFAYLVYLSQRQRDLRRQVEELRRALAEKESQQG
ncbi:MAG: hypothetical protein HW388_346 [Dehalococcoidia bacterium]|nr:hypothetical protein [Dehalococcoidia bacterium]